MPEPKRNDPCPCGSGRKYKNCCGKVVRNLEVLKARILRAESRLADEVVRWVTSKYGDVVLDLAWDDFAMGVLGHEWFLDDEVPFEVLFLPWWLFSGTLAEGDDPPALQYLDESGSPEDSFERRLVLAVAASPFSFYRIADVDPGRSMSLEDIMTGVRHEVRDSAAATEDRRDAYLFGRVVTIDTLSVLVGCGPLLVEPSMFSYLKVVRDGLQEDAGGKLEMEDLHDYADEIRMAYMGIASRILNPGPRQFTNTDGDPMALTRLIFDLGCDCETAFGKLWTLAEGWKRSALLDRADRDETGRLCAIEFDWVKQGPNPTHPGWSNTILGNLVLEEGRLEVEVNSQQRAERIKAEIKRRLGRKAKFRHAVVESIDKMMEEAQERARARSGRGAEPEFEEPSEHDPAVREAVEKMIAVHWETWFDHPIPALQGMTPREAAKSEEGRELLQALFADYTRKSKLRPGAPTNPDIPMLRRELGLD